MLLDAASGANGLDRIVFATIVIRCCVAAVDRELVFADLLAVERLLESRHLVALGQTADRDLLAGDRAAVIGLGIGHSLQRQRGLVDAQSGDTACVANIVALLRGIEPAQLQRAVLCAVGTGILALGGMAQVAAKHGAGHTGGIAAYAAAGDRAIIGLASQCVGFTVTDFSKERSSGVV